MLGGDSFCMDDYLGMEDPLGEDVFQTLFSIHALEATPQFYPCSCLRTSNIWEGRTVIFQNLPTTNWNIKFY